MKKENSLFIVYAVLVFGILLCFFAIFDAIAVFDTDDWEYIYTMRSPIPILHIWNPTRVYPEFFLPLVSFAGTYLIYPIVRNFCYSLTLAHSIFISLMLSVYFTEFVILVYKRLTKSKLVCAFSGALFFILHFVIFLHFGGGNETLLHAQDLSCLYFYTTSTAINAALVMHVISHGGINQIKKYSFMHKAVVFIWFYFAAFSNLYSSIVYAAYVGSTCLADFYEEKSKKSLAIKRFCSEHKIHFFVLVVWLLTHVIEKTGGRSGDRSENLLSSLVTTTTNLISDFRMLNFLVLVFAVVVIILWRKKHIDHKAQAIKIMLSFVITLLYVFALSVIVNSWYITRPDVIFAFGFWILLAMALCFAELLLVDPKYGWTITIILASAIMIASGYGNMFRPLNYRNLSYTQCEAIMNDIISQLKLAEEEGIEEIDLVVPKFETDDNWPIAMYAKDRFPEALYKHHVIKTVIKVNKLVPSEEKSKVFLME